MKEAANQHLCGRVRQRNRSTRLASKSEASAGLANPGIATNPEKRNPDRIAPAGVLADRAASLPVAYIPQENVRVEP